MDEATATQAAGEQIVRELGAEAGFMISLRILQAIAQRAAPTPELLESFRLALEGMERFAKAAGLGEKPAGTSGTAS